MSDQPVASPRWTVQITPQPNGEASMDIEVHADNVPAAEVALGLSKCVTRLVSIAFQRLPTVAENEARQKQAALTREHPATHIFAKAGEETKLWIGEAAFAEFGQTLARDGWIDLGAPPEGVRKPCDYQADPDAFKTAWIPKPVVVEEPPDGGPA